MKILLTGDTAMAIVILTTIDWCNKLPVVVNPVGRGTYINALDEIDGYLDMCSRYNDVSGAIQIYNDSPWSNLLLDRTSAARHIKEKIYNMCGWKPDAIIHIYNSVTRRNDTEIFDTLTNIQIYSLDSADDRFEKNLGDILDIICHLTD
jgi:hypothetical protein